MKDIRGMFINHDKFSGSMAENIVKRRRKKCEKKTVKTNLSELYSERDLQSDVINDLIVE